VGTVTTSRFCRRADGLIDTDGDRKVNHATTLVHLNMDLDTVLKKMKAIA